MLHGVAGPRGTRLGQLLADDLPVPGRFRPLVGGFERVVASVSGPPEPIAAAAAGLPEGAAQAEALAVRLRRDGVPLVWGKPLLVASPESSSPSPSNADSRRSSSPGSTPR